MPEMLRVREVAARLCIKQDVVLTWIRSGELKAVNVALKFGGRPRWRIDSNDLATFLELRRAMMRPIRMSRRRRTALVGVIEFF
jgi:excisionase family DNA binding protein